MKPKENYCQVAFYCTEPKRKKCAYFMATEDHEDCKFSKGELCNSSVAMVNRMTVLKKRLLEAR